MTEIRREEIIENTGLSTAALAHADEPIEQELVERRDDGRDMSASVGSHMRAGVEPPAETDAQPALFSQDESKAVVREMGCSPGGLCG